MPWPNLRLNKILDVRATLVFQRLQRFYHSFNIIATLLGGLALAVMTFDEFHINSNSNSNSNSNNNAHLIDAAATLLTSAALSAIVAVMVATMLLFRFEGHERPTRGDLLIAWVPLVLLDFVIVEVLLGILLWYVAKYTGSWTGWLVGFELVGLLGATVVLAVWMWRTMSEKGGLGAEEQRVVGKGKGGGRVADG